MPTGLTPSLSATKFAVAYESFCERVKAASGEPFKDFGSGLPEQWEGYKEWVYHSARLILAWDDWKPAHIGRGSILKQTLRAIELHESKIYRNNLVQWDARFGDKSRTHARLRDAAKSQQSTKNAEQALFNLFRDVSDEQTAFEEIRDVVGSRYDVIGYLFFLKDWTRFMPVRPAAFSKAFDQLGMPHKMTGQCSWENYSGYLDRLAVVQHELSEYGVPGVRLIDAHSFCWMLARLPKVTRARPCTFHWIEQTPLAIGSRTTKPRESASASVSVDFAALEEVKRRIGALAQLRVMEAEVERLTKAGRADLAKKVEDVSVNASLGYDIRSYRPDGTDKFIEVKAAAVSGSTWRFFLSENERLKSCDLKGYVFALVQGVDLSQPTIWEFTAQDLPHTSLRPISYEVRVKCP